MPVKEYVMDNNEVKLSFLIICAAFITLITGTAYFTKQESGHIRQITMSQNKKVIDGYDIILGVFALGLVVIYLLFDIRIF